MKVDGCGPASYYEQGYKAMGAALQASGRPIEYSCSWPAYINHGNESLQPFATFIEYGCNGWRNWHDIGCSAGSFMSIIVRRALAARPAPGAALRRCLACHRHLGPWPGLRGPCAATMM